MKVKLILFIAFVILHSSTALLGQSVPSYVPTSGLVGYWPFNGNANDESGNGLILNNSFVQFNNDAQRGSVANFNGNSWLQADTSIFRSRSPITITFWARTAKNYSMDIVGQACGNDCNDDIRVQLNAVQCGYTGLSFKSPSHFATAPGAISDSNWHHFALVLGSNNNYSYNNFQFYIDGAFVAIGPNQCGHNWGGWTYNPNSNYRLTIGKAGPLGYFFNGKLDDVGIWNRALTPQEITKLNQGCNDSIITIEPVNTSVGLGLNAQFTTTSATGSTYQWQTNPLNIGWMNVPANSYYNGVNTNTLRVNNVSVSNHNQPFRALVNSNGCSDTSNVANLQVADTCLTKVTDTLIIKTTVGLPTPNTTNTLLIYPNPAKDRITIDNGNYTVMAGYSIKIENSLGQQVFSSAITQAQFNIDLSTWTGKGIYFVRVLDTQGNVVTTRKILLQ
jgi:hypothetical protein